jgi:hypothetical protein
MKAMKTTLAAAMMLGLAATAGAQVMVHDAQSKAAAEQHQLQVLVEKAQAGGVHVSIGSPVVTGLPYSGEAVTESVQTLADGNRIVKRNTVRVYRDSAGSTRRETIGPDGQVTTTMISNPKSGISFVFDPRSNTAHKTFSTTTDTVVSRTGGGSGGGRYTYYVSEDGKRGAETEARLVAKIKTEEEAKAAQFEHQKAQVEAKTAHAQKQAQAHATTIESTVTTDGPLTWVSHTTTTGPPPTKEDLGVQTIEGVPAKGTRTTTVIPAGAVGNEQPFSIVSEEWFSADLKVLIMTKHADPRSGETTYRLMNILRAEPDASLFELPAGVTVK